ncbi:MAG: hypothetical protein IPJ34_31030 [Myxococcales bacterium]|nr:hypothetical protein [Myxococcales bacterium]
MAGRGARRASSAASIAQRIHAGDPPASVVRAVFAREAPRLALARDDEGVRAAFALVASLYRAPEALTERLGLDRARANGGARDALALAAAAVELLDAAVDGLPSELAELVQLAALEVLMRGGSASLAEALRALAARIAERLVAAHVSLALARGPHAETLRAEVAVRASIEQCARERVAVAAASITGRGSVRALLGQTFDAIATGLGGLR